MRYYSLSEYLKNKYGEKYIKLSLDAGLSCPNRDGRLSTGGCIFCSQSGSGDFAEGGAELNSQIERAKLRVQHKAKSDKFIAYFQSFTGTYAPASRLRELYLPVACRDDIAILSIATRPDCLDDSVLEVLSELREKKPLWIELGLQTSNDRTAEFINRCYPTECYDLAVSRLHSIGAEVITHLIVGLPGESAFDMRESVRHIASVGTDGVKLQLLHIIKGTRLCELYERGEVKALSLEEYAELICMLLENLPPQVVVHRLTGDGSRDSLAAPLWSLDKKRVLNYLNSEMKKRAVIQGKLYK